MSQSLPEGWGSVSLSTLWRDYWGRSGSSKDYQLSYSNNLAADKLYPRGKPGL